MFDREAALRQWRLSLLGRGGVTVRDLDELQEHLLEIEGELVGAPLSPEERFWLAAHRLGGADELTQEFLLVHPERGWWPRLQWALLGLLASRLLFPLGYAAFMLLAVLAVRLGLPDLIPLTLEALSYPLGSAVSILALVWGIRRARAAPETLDGALSRAASYPRPWVVVLGLGTVAYVILVNRLLNLAFVLFQDTGLENTWVPGMGIVYWLFGAYGYVMPFALVAAIVWLQRKREQATELS